MKYFCEKCQRCFEEEDIISSSEYGMFIPLCPECHGLLEEKEVCKICGQLYDCVDEKSNKEVCNKCLHEHDDDIDFWFGMCSANGITELVSINAVLFSAFTEDEIEEILLKELRKRCKENPKEYNCARFVDEDPEWAADMLKENN